MAEQIADETVELAALPKEERLARMRHSAAHVLAEAMTELMPMAKLGIGPPIDTGFYYDFDLPRPLQQEDLGWLEARMRESIAAGLPFVMASLSKEEAEGRWKDQPYKLDLLADLEEGSVTQCTHGNFTDLCRGGHVNRTSEIPAFRLVNIAGAYWKGSEKNPQLQRVYGALFETQEELGEYDTQLEEARRKDHRRIGRELKIFTFADEVGPGHVMWRPAGATVRRELERWITDLELERGYQHVVTPVVAKVDLYKRSGHWQHFKDAMYPVMEADGEEYVLRPMNCPHHILLYAADQHSYRELPIRIAELADMHRFEKSGELSGLARVRIMTLNDAHIFCAGTAQVEQEVEGVLQLMEEAYGVLGLTDYRYQLSLKDDDNEKYVDNPDMWAEGTALLRRVLRRLGLEFEEAPGEAAFYGPKIDLQFRTASGKEETLVTVQVDFHLPEQFELEYIAEDGERRRPVMVHRGVISTMERMVGLLLERYEGNFPLWLAPTQVIVIPIADRHVEYANEVVRQLRAAKLRVELDARNERMNSKVRDAQLRKVPYTLVVGDREAEAGSAAVRVRGGGNLGATPVAEIVSRLREERDTRRLTL